MYFYQCRDSVPHPDNVPCPSKVNEQAMPASQKFCRVNLKQSSRKIKVHNGPRHFALLCYAMYNFRRRRVDHHLLNADERRCPDRGTSESYGGQRRHCAVPTIRLERTGDSCTPYQGVANLRKFSRRSAAENRLLPQEKIAQTALPPVCRKTGRCG